ncbi:MAG TPA: hypothetical protein VH744_10750, partial [Terriglobales bacterium]
MGITAVFGVFVSLAAGQEAGGQQPIGATPPPAATMPAFGQDPPAAQTTQFPPLSGLDEASLESNLAARSYLQPVLQASEGLDTNVGNSLGRSTRSFTGVTRVLGSVGVQRLWSRYQLALDYLAGGAFYAGNIRSSDQMHELAFNSKVLWRTGVLQFRDIGSYLPEGRFGAWSVGGMGALGELGTGGLGAGIENRFDFFGGGQFGNLGTTPRINNL